MAPTRWCGFSGRTTGGPAEPADTVLCRRFRTPLAVFAGTWRVDSSDWSTRALSPAGFLESLVRSEVVRARVMSAAGKPLIGLFDSRARRRRSPTCWSVAGKRVERQLGHWKVQICLLQRCRTWLLRSRVIRSRRWRLPNARAVSWGCLVLRASHTRSWLFDTPMSKVCPQIWQRAVPRRTKSSSGGCCGFRRLGITVWLGCLAQSSLMSEMRAGPIGYKHLVPSIV